MANIEAVTTADFGDRVLEASRTHPVLVDFWAPWRGPCRMLAPALEEIARELAGRLRVVKVDTDQEPQLAQRFGIRGIPAVKLFRDGRVVAEFVGVQPAAAIRAFLAPHLPRPSEDARQAALALAATGDIDAAVGALDAVLAADPENAQAALDRVRLLARAGRAAEAQAAFEALPAAIQLEPAAAPVKALVYFAALIAASEPQSERAAAARALLAGEVTQALDRWLALMEADRRFARAEGRADLLQAFELVGADDPRVAPYRRRLAALVM